MLFRILNIEITYLMDLWFLLFEIFFFLTFQASIFSHSTTCPHSSVITLLPWITSRVIQEEAYVYTYTYPHVLVCIVCVFCHGCVYGSEEVGVNGAQSPQSVGGEAQRSIKTVHQPSQKQQCLLKTTHFCATVNHMFMRSHKTLQTPTTLLTRTNLSSFSHTDKTVQNSYQFAPIGSIAVFCWVNSRWLYKILALGITVKLLEKCTN